MSAVDQLLSDADQEWSDGCLSRAYALYDQAAKADPGNWHAAFQMAWIDAAFGPVEPQRLSALDRADLPESARDLLEILGSS